MKDITFPHKSHGTQLECRVNFEEDRVTLIMTSPDDSSHTIVFDADTLLPLSESKKDSLGRSEDWTYEEIKRLGQVYLRATSAIATAQTARLEDASMDFLERRFGETSAKTWYNVLDIAIDLLDSDELRQKFNAATEKLGYKISTEKETGTRHRLR